MVRSPGTVTLMGSLGLSYAYTGRCDKAMPLFSQGLMMSSQGEGLSDNLSGTIEEGKQQVMVSIFYVGYSHCATSLQSMLDYVKKALEVRLTRDCFPPPNSSDGVTSCAVHIVFWSL